MAKKVKCSDCSESMNWSLPLSVNSGNIDYAKHCLMLAKRSIVCGYTMKSKSKDHEQYCKHFEKKTYDINYQKEIDRLDKLIEEYEKVGEQNDSTGSY